MSSFARLFCSAPWQRPSCVWAGAASSSRGLRCYSGSRSLLLASATQDDRTSARQRDLDSPAGSKLLCSVARRPLNARHLWHKAVNSSTESAPLENADTPNLEKVDPPRLSFYSSSSGGFTHGNTLEDLSSHSPCLDLILKSDDKHITIPGDAPSDKPSYWLDILQPSTEEILHLGAKLGIHRLTIEDILMGETQEKLERHPGYRFVSYRSFNADAKSATYLESINVYILLFPHGTLTLRSGVYPNSSRIAKRLEERHADAKTRTNEWIMFEIIDAITDGFSLALKPMRVNIEQLSDSLVAVDGSRGKDSAASLRLIASARRKVLALRRLLGSKSEVVKALVKRYSIEPRSEISLNFSDVEDHVHAISQDLSHWEETLAQSENSCLIQLNLQTSQAQNESSEAISKLTILSTVILPLNVITGLWGMNVQVPGQGVESLSWFGGLATVMFLTATTGYLWATRFMRRHRRAASKHH